MKLNLKLCDFCMTLQSDKFSSLPKCKKIMHLGMNSSERRVLHNIWRLNDWGRTFFGEILKCSLELLRRVRIVPEVLVTKLPSSLKRQISGEISWRGSEANENKWYCERLWGIFIFSECLTLQTDGQSESSCRRGSVCDWETRTSFGKVFRSRWGFVSLYMYLYLSHFAAKVVFNQLYFLIFIVS